MIKIGKRKQVYRKYGGRCAYCGCSLELINMTVDHIVPKAAGGGDDIENLNPSCQRCNFMKGKLTLSDFVVQAARIAYAAEPDPKQYYAIGRSARDCALYYKQLAESNKQVGILPFPKRA